MNTTTGSAGGRPMIMSARGVVSSGHYLATEIGLDVLRDGGNAFDAAAATGFALTVLQPHQNGIGGEVPMVVYSAADKKVWAVSGHGIAPRAATLERLPRTGAARSSPATASCRRWCPPRFGSWILLLRKFGTLRLSRLLAPVDRAGARSASRCTTPCTTSIAGNGEPLPRRMALLGGSLPGQRRAAEIRRLSGGSRTGRRRSTGCAALDEKHAKRDDGLRAAYDAFYRGEIAERIVAFAQATHIPRRLRPGAQRPADARGLRRLQPAARGAGAHRLSRHRRPQVRPVDAGPGAPAGAEPARGVST